MKLDFEEAPREKESDIAERLEHLYNYSWCERRERGGEGERGQEYELHQLVRELVRARFQNRFQDRFLRLVHDLFTDEGVHFTVKERYYLQLEEALAAASAKGDERLKKWMYDLFDFCTYRGYADFYIRLTQQVERLFPRDRWALRVVYGHRALIYRRQGKLAEAMKYHKKEEKIKEELGDRAGLARTWWNQGLIYNQNKNYRQQIKLWKQSIQINKEFGIPTTEDEKALEKLLKEIG